MGVTNHQTVTVMIVLRIWLVDRRSSALRADPASDIHIRLRFIARIIIESALLYTCSSIFVFGTLVAHNKIASIAAAIVSSCVSSTLPSIDKRFKNTQVLGIAFNLILIRLSWAAKSQSRNTTTTIDVG